MRIVRLWALNWKETETEISQLNILKEGHAEKLHLKNDVGEHRDRYFEDG